MDEFTVSCWCNCSTNKNIKNEQIKCTFRLITVGCDRTGSSPSSYRCVILKRIRSKSILDFLSPPWKIICTFWILYFTLSLCYETWFLFASFVVYSILWPAWVETVEVLGVIRTVAPARDAEGLHVEVLGQHNRLNKRPTTFLSLIPRLFCVREKFTFLCLFLLTKNVQNTQIWKINVIVVQYNLGKSLLLHIDNFC